MNLKKLKITQVLKKLSKFCQVLKIMKKYFENFIYFLKIFFCIICYVLPEARRMVYGKLSYN